MPDEAPWSDLKATIYSLMSRRPRTNRSIGELVDLAESGRTLDIGCGPGAAVRAAAAEVERAVGVDASPRMVEIARRRSRSYSNVEFEVGPAEELPFADDSFTVAWAIQSWHHWNDTPGGLTEATRVLAPGGTFSVIERKSGGAHGLSARTATDLGAAFVSAGFVDASVLHLGKYYVVSGSVPLR